MQFELRLTTHPDLEESYLDFLRALKSKGRPSGNSNGFYQSLAMKLGLIKKANRKKVTGNEPLFLSSVYQARILGAEKRKQNISKNKISVIVCSKGRDSLMEAVNSLLNQTVLPDEILVFLDGVSLDKLNKLKIKLESFCVCPIKLFHSKKIKGPGFGRNYLARHASHPLLVFFDDDNLAFPIFLESLRTTYSKFQISAVTTARISFFQEKRGGNRNYQDLIVPFGSDLIAGLSFDLMGDSTMLISKKDFDSVNGFSVRTDVHEDTFLLNKLCLKNKIIMPFPLPTLLYRRTKNSRMLDVDMDTHDQLLMRLWSRHFGTSYKLLRQFRAIGLARTMVHRMTNSKRLQISKKLIRNWQIGKWS